MTGREQQQRRQQRRKQSEQQRGQQKRQQQRRQGLSQEQNLQLQPLTLDQQGTTTKVAKLTFEITASRLLFLLLSFSEQK